MRSRSDLSQPGHIFPLMAQPGGVLNRAGHTEAASDLALLAGLEPAGVLVEILNADGSMARRPQLEAFAREHGLKIGSIEELIRYRLDHRAHRRARRRARHRHRTRPVPAASPIATASATACISRCCAARPTPTSPTLVRVHMQNPLADALHWRRADFGPAVGDVLAAIAREGRGALVLLGETPGRRRAAGAHPRSSRRRRADAPTRRPRLAEWRRNGAGAQILADLGLGKLRVLGTPRKQVGLAGFGLEVVEYVESRLIAASASSRRRCHGSR